MAFVRRASRVPERIGRLAIYLTTPDPTLDPAPGQANYQVEVVYNDGSTEDMAGDLAPELTQGQITALLNFMGDLRQLAIDRILPEPQE